jgi:hypothetical protein
MSQPTACRYRLSRDDFLKQPILEAGSEYGLCQLATGVHMNVVAVFRDPDWWALPTVTHEEKGFKLGLCVPKTLFELMP